MTDLLGGARPRLEQQVAGHRLDGTGVAAEMAEQAEDRTVVEAPARDDASVSSRHRAQALRPAQVRRQRGGAQRQQAAIEGPSPGIVDDRKAALERGGIVGVGNGLGLLAVLEAFEAGELASPW